MTAERHHSAVAERTFSGSTVPISPTANLLPVRQCVLCDVASGLVAGGSGYPFKLPAVRPDMMLFWNSRKKMMVGIAAITAAATTTFIGVPPENA